MCIAKKDTARARAVRKYGRSSQRLYPERSNLARIKKATRREISVVSKRSGCKVPVVANSLVWQNARSQRTQFRVGGTFRNLESQESQVSPSISQQGTFGNGLRLTLDLHL